MAKLFDLMVMTAKLQLAVSTEPDAPYTVAMRHVHHVRALLERASAAKGEGDDARGCQAVTRLDAFRSKLCVAFQGVSRATWLSVRAQALTFFEDQHVRVRSPSPRRDCRLQATAGEHFFVRTHTTPVAQHERKLAEPVRMRQRCAGVTASTRGLAGRRGPLLPAIAGLLR